MKLQSDKNYFWQGDSIRLRPIHTDDWELEYQESSDSKANRFFADGIELPQSPEITKKLFEESLVDFKDKNNYIAFSIESLAGELVGNILIHTKDQKNGTFSFGIKVSRPYRQKGYAEEATRIILRYAFHELRYQKANSGCLEMNQASIRLHQKVGFVEEGRRRRNIYTNGRYYASILFGLTREEFEENERNTLPVG